MADQNNLTTLAKRLRPLLGNYIQGLVGASIGEGPGIDNVVSGDITTVGLGGDTVLLYDHISGGAPVAEFATIGLALAAASSGQFVQVPPGTFIEDIVVPAGVSLVGIGSNSIVQGTITLLGNYSVAKWMTIIVTVTSGSDVLGFIGPASGIGVIDNCHVILQNNGAGNVYTIQVNDGNIQVKESWLEAYTFGGGDAIGVLGNAGGDGVSDDNIIYALAVGGGHGHAFEVIGPGNIYAVDGHTLTSTSPVGV